MAPRHRTARGEPFDMARLRDLNAHKPAIGNANSNARGDFIDKKGTVIKTQEQIVAEIALTKKRQQAITKPVNIKSDGLIPDLNNKTTSPPIKPLAKQVNVEDQSFDPISTSLSEKSDKLAKIDKDNVSTRRKITETDN